MAGTKRCKIKKGDVVQVIVGKDYNRYDRNGKRVPLRGRVIDVLPGKGKVKVEGVAIVKKHQRANPQSNRGGGIIDKEAYIDISNVQLIDPESGLPTRVRYESHDDGTKTRVATKSGQELQK